MHTFLCKQVCEEKPTEQQNVGKTCSCVNGISTENEGYSRQYIDETPQTVSRKQQRRLKKLNDRQHFFNFFIKRAHPI